MASSLNKVMLIGNIGADPVIRQTQDGKRLAQLSLATSESWKDKSTGEKKEKTKAEILKKKLQKFGTIVYLVSGDLSKEKDVKKIIKFSKSKMKFFDCLVNNASIFENDKLENFSSKYWEKHISINLKAPALLSKEFSKNIRGKNNNIVCPILSKYLNQL